MRNLSTNPFEPSELRVLLLTPVGRDAELLADTLRANSVEPEACKNVTSLCSKIHSGAAVAVVAREVLRGDNASLLQTALRDQPAWSDLPLIVLTGKGSSPDGDIISLSSLLALGNATIIDRPFEPLALVSLVKSALRARLRQYEMRDALTERESLLRSEKSARAADELHYRRLVEGVKDYAIFSLDVDGMITSWNAGAERIKQYKESEIVGQNYSKFYTPEDIARDLPRTNLKLAAERGQLESEGWRLRKDGTRFWSSVVITAIRDDEGKLTGFSKITRDATDRKFLLDRIQQHTVELEQRIEERDRMYGELEAFSYSISHDLRAPLRAIEGFTVALREDLGEISKVAVQEDLKQISAAAERMSALINDLLEYSRLSRSQLAFHLFSVEDMIREVIEREEVAATRIRTSIEPGLRLQSHKAALEQAILNLVENALKFHKPGQLPEVTITVVRKGQYLRIAVSDRGIGIAPEYYDRIFHVFQRLHTSDAYPGTGIGLALVKRIVERLGGHVGLESEVGKGSTFWIEVPAA